MDWSGFIVRPFGRRKVQPANGGEPYELDFDRVQQDLIDPAMRQAGIAGSTTGSILQAGNIREDMFQLLAHADVVIADISLHNANVFYELGARHALRPKRTFMIRYNGDEVPFDIKTDRYLSYDRNNPGASVADLTAGLLATLADRDGIDSPIFKLLPALKAPSVADLVPVPLDFRDELARAVDGRYIGQLVLLGEEANALPWGAEGLRLVGRALGKLGAQAPALAAWELLRRRAGNDVEADLQLATLYQRQGSLADSDSAIARALAHPQAVPRQQAEALALRASNAKSRWRDAWQGLAPAQAAARALQSPHLVKACDDYAAAYATDLNHSYSGINALMLARLRIDIATAQPEAWADGHDSDDEAQRALKDLQAELDDLMGAVRLAVRGAEARLAATDGDDPWLRCTAADLQLLRKERPKRVLAGYQRALEGAPPAVFDSLRRQWAMLAQLGVFADLLPSLTPLLDSLAPQLADANTPAGPERVILFSGHRIDEAGRAVPRFPAAAEPAARQAISDQLQTLMAGWPAGSRVRGIAGGASGGDILFHEACAALAIPTALYLPMPAEAFVARSVQVAGAPAWVPRFYAIRQRCQAAGLLRQLSDSDKLPNWLAPQVARAGYTVWTRCNRWMLHAALAHGADKLMLLALWNGQGGDGPGGTQDMVNAVRGAGAQWMQIGLPVVGGAALPTPIPTPTGSAPMSGTN